MNPIVKWIPDRKIWAGGVSWILAWYVLALLGQHGIDVQPVIDAVWPMILPGQATPAAQPLLAGLIAAAVAYLVPASAKDVIRKITDDVAKVAGYLPAPSTATLAPATQAPPVMPTVTAHASHDAPRPPS